MLNILGIAFIVLLVAAAAFLIRKAVISKTSKERFGALIEAVAFLLFAWLCYSQIAIRS